MELLQGTIQQHNVQHKEQQERAIAAQVALPGAISGALPAAGISAAETSPGVASGVQGKFDSLQVLVQNKDQINFSVSAQQLLAAQKERFGSESIRFDSLYSFTAANGITIDLEGIQLSGDRQYNFARATFSNEDVRQEVLFSGSVSISFGKTGVTSLQSAIYQSGNSGTSGKALVDNEQIFYGTDADTLYILIPSKDVPAREQHIIVHAGNGNNTVIDLSNAHTMIHSGSGTDTVLNFGTATTNASPTSMATLGHAENAPQLIAQRERWLAQRELLQQRYFQENAVEATDMQEGLAVNLLSIHHVLHNMQEETRFITAQSTVLHNQYDSEPTDEVDQLREALKVAEKALAATQKKNKPVTVGAPQNLNSHLYSLLTATDASDADRLSNRYIAQIEQDAALNKRPDVKRKALDQYVEVDRIKGNRVSV